MWLQIILLTSSCLDIRASLLLLSKFCFMTLYYIFSLELLVSPPVLLSFQIPIHFQMNSPNQISSILGSLKLLCFTSVHHLPLAAMHRGSNLRLAKGKMEMWCPLLKMMRIQDGDIRALNPVQECLWSTGPVTCSVEAFSSNASTTYISQQTAYHLPWNICSVYVSVTPRNCDFHEGTHHTLIFSEVL